MTTFALVHGAWHGAWCWEPLVPEIERHGHRAIAMDLPCDDPSATFDDYADTVIAALDGHDDVVLVGHSLGGLTVPRVAARRPVSRLVYLCALIPIVGRSFVEQFTLDDGMLHPDYGRGVATDEQGRSSWIDAEVAREHFYADCSEEAARDAFARLRPQSSAPYGQPFPLDAFPDVPATYIVCTDDRMVLPPWSRTVAAPRAGAELVELPGGHSPFLSRPAALADVLADLA